MNPLLTTCRSMHRGFQLFIVPFECRKIVCTVPKAFWLWDDSIHWGIDFMNLSCVNWLVISMKTINLDISFWNSVCVCVCEGCQGDRVTDARLQWGDRSAFPKSHFVPKGRTWWWWCWEEEWEGQMLTSLRLCLVRSRGGEGCFTSTFKAIPQIRCRNGCCNYQILSVPFPMIWSAFSFYNLPLLPSLIDK